MIASLTNKTYTKYIATLHRIVRFHWICSNDIVKLKLQMQQKEFKVLMHLCMYMVC